MDLIEALQFWCELEPVEYLEGRELSVIEYAVREAIEARGVDWWVRRHGGGTHSAKISSTDGYGVIHDLHEAYAISAAHALLLAYIAYLEGLVSL